MDVWGRSFWHLMHLAWGGGRVPGESDDEAAPVGCAASPVVLTTCPIAMGGCNCLIARIIASPSRSGRARYDARLAEYQAMIARFEQARDRYKAEYDQYQASYGALYPK